MRYRRLGRSAAEVSEIGFGAWGVGGTHGGAVAYGPTDDAVSRRALRRAVERGITCFDTADMYGCGHSERLLGEELAPDRARVFLATKAGMLDAAGTQDFSPGYLREALDRSLARLRTGYVDLFQLHSPPIDAVAGNRPLLDALADLKRAGKARHVGISVRSPAEGLRAAELPIDALQVNYNLTDQRAAVSGLLDLCGRRGIGVIVRTPLCFGFLAGVSRGDAGFDPADHRSRWSPAQRALWEDAHRRFAGLLAAAPGLTPAQFALCFCLAHPAVSTVIPGMLTPEQVEENAAAADAGPLSAEQMAGIARIDRENVFFLPGRA
ncbi:MAG: aldo/keto reductase [Planctomycetes bacterium]|nr:aldo/keto reductase [Planctomycetota bacterium]